MTRTDAIKRAVMAILEKQRRFLDSNDVKTLRIDLRIQRDDIIETQFMPSCVESHVVSHDRLNGYNFST